MSRHSTATCCSSTVGLGYMLWWHVHIMAQFEYPWTCWVNCDVNELSCWLLIICSGIQSILRRLMAFSVSSIAPRQRAICVHNVVNTHVLYSIQALWLAVYVPNGIKPRTVPPQCYIGLPVSHKGSCHSMKLRKQRCRLDVRLHFFSERVMNLRNNLDDQTVAASVIIELFQK